MTPIPRGIYCSMLTVTLVFGLVTVSRADQLAEATRAFDAGDFARAATLYKPLAGKGNALAQYHMGILYSQGLVLQPDYSTALQWFMMAAEAHNADAQRELGVLYLSGRGVRQNFKQALTWFRLSAEQDDANAQLYLGRIFAEGTGVQKDYKLAEYWYRKSASQGNAGAQYELAECFLNGACGKRDEDAALSWLELAVGNAVDSASREKYALLRDKTAEQIASKGNAPGHLDANISPKQTPILDSHNVNDQLVLTKPEADEAASQSAGEVPHATSLPSESDSSAKVEVGVADAIVTAPTQNEPPADPIGEATSNVDSELQDGQPAVEAVKDVL
ncbi:MAG: tetratricopeptide repeat protein [Gallionella sp.]